MNIEIPIFASGTHTAMNGAERTYTDDDLAAIAQAYDPDLFEAPVVIGHPEHNDPAWGWVENLILRDSVLWASLRDLHPDFVELIKAKQFKKVSASFYLPESPINPNPGAFYLRHIGFLGAVAPSLKNLPAVNLTEADNALVFEEAMQYHPAMNLLQSGQTANRTQTLNHTENSPMPDKKEDDRIKEVEAENARIKAENEQLKAQSTQYQEQTAAAQAALAERERAATHAAHAAFCEKLADEGRLLPATQAVAVAALDLIAAQEAPLEFSEGDGKVELTVDKFKAALSSFPKVVEFGERTADNGGIKPKRTTNVPAGFDVDPKTAELHNKALAYQEAHPGITYLAAVGAVS